MSLTIRGKHGIHYMLVNRQAWDTCYMIVNRQAWDTCYMLVNRQAWDTCYMLVSRQAWDTCYMLVNRQVFLSFFLWWRSVFIFWGFIAYLNEVRTLNFAGLRALAWWDYEFESCQGHGCLLLGVVCCQVEVCPTAWPLCTYNGYVEEARLRRNSYGVFWPEYPAEQDVCCRTSSYFCWRL